MIQPALEKQGWLDRLREELLGPPGQSWSDYYARAGWLRQQRSWAELVALYRQVTASGFKPANAVEWLPFIEALDRTGEYGHAEELLCV